MQDGDVKPVVAKTKKIGMLTSGGDSSGMNAAVRAIARMSLANNCIPFAIFEGYQGLVDGGNKIQALTWDHVRGLLAVVSTSIYIIEPILILFKKKTKRVELL
jgi:6-phosphofructokinase 1